MFTCVCAWSGWYWAFPTKDSTQETAAHYLFHNVICDLAGYPVCLGSDGGWSFVTGVVQALVKLFDITHVIGSAYHPQAQGVVERPHREYNKICKTFMEEYSDWDLVVSIFVWSVRTSAKLYNSLFTPYEVITGLKPRSPVDAVLAMNVTPERVSHSKYVADLVAYLKTVHKHVDEQHERVRSDADRERMRKFGPGEWLSVGDYVLVQRPLIVGVSARFQRKNFDEVYQIVEAHGDGADIKAYTVSDLKGQRDDLGFTQPIAAERLTPVDMLPLLPPSEDQRTRILLTLAGSERAGTVINQFLDGRVTIRFDDDGSERCYDLCKTRYRWLT